MFKGQVSLAALVACLLATPAFAVEGQHGQMGQKVEMPVGAVKNAKVFFTNIKDGDTIGQDFVAKFAVEGLKVEKAGQIVPGTGHFHVLINTPALSEGQVVPTDEKHLHFGKGQTEAQLKLPPGTHTLVLQFADGAHRAYNKMLTQEVKVTVK